MDKVAKWIAGLLKIARITHVLAATACIAAAAIGCLVLLYLQFVIEKGPSVVPVPQVTRIEMPPVRPETIDRRLTPPGNPRIVIVRPSIGEKIDTSDVLGYLEAGAANGLARYPDSIDILGGRDTELFDRKDQGGSNSERGAALVPTAKFVELVNRTIADRQAPEQRDFALTLIARDRHGLLSAVTDVTFTLSFGLFSAAPSPPPSPPPVLASAVSDLDRLARDIALSSGQENTKEYADTFQRARAVPDICGGGQDRDLFVTSYRMLFERAKERLNPRTLTAFFAGVCDAWTDAVSEQRRALATVENARVLAVNRNRAAESDYLLERANAWATRSMTLTVVGGAFVAFLVLCFVLAFLALENHSNVMRVALKELADTRRQRE